MRKLIATLGVCVSLLVGSLPGSSQEGCFPNKHLTFPYKVIARQMPSRNSPVTGYLTPKQPYNVLESSTYQDICWARTNRGWVIPASRGYSQETPTATPETADSCYPYPKAYITGSMNIRSGPSTSNSKVASAKSGESLSVLRSQQGKEHCWLEIAKGWIAKTTRVRATKPPAYSPSSTNTSSLPRINAQSAQEAAERKIGAALQHLEKSFERYYNYVLDVVEDINVVPGLTLGDEEAAAVAHFPEQTVSIHPRHALESSSSVLAATLVHEACHLHQGLDGYAKSAGIFERETLRERECYTIEALVLKKLDPDKKVRIEKLRCLGREYNQFFSVDFIIKFVCGIGW